MDKKEQILHYYRVDGLSLREISRRVGLNRKTVTRYVREYEDSIKVDPEEGLDMCLASKPKYPSRNVERTRLTDPVCAEIEYWLQENAKRRQTGMRKQCLKKQDIHRALIEKGFDISYSSVCKYKKAVYAQQTAAAKEKGESNCPLYAIGHDANHTKIWDLKDMDADHVTAWSKGGSTDIENCQMLC
ncbi:MAG: helix-turn-helix domain-containing protein [Bacteroidaceae bacterium]|nr:helix-turn-helix domain-containing protein [Bacteroidaceae bacterium]